MHIRSNTIHTHTTQLSFLLYDNVELGGERKLHTTACINDEDTGGKPSTPEDTEVLSIAEIRDKLDSGKKLPLFCMDLVRYPGTYKLVARA